jgi:translocation protein SEC62
MPSPEQIAQMQRQIAADAEAAGMTVPQFIEQLKRQAMEQQRMRQQMMQQQQAQGGGHDHDHDHDHPHPHQHQQQQQGVAQPIVPGPPNPIALALAKFLRGQDLKPRTVILNGDRKDMFRGEKARFSKTNESSVS